MTRPTPTRHPNEEGYILLWVIFLLAVFTLAMSVAVPRIAKEIQLDRERETMERGKQYTRAIQLYYRKFHAYPPSADALVKTTEIRFLRKKYVDPITGKDDWKPILFGQNKVPTAMGFFGQPLAGSASTIAGTGPSGGNGLNGASPIGGSGSSFGGSGSTFGGSSIGSSSGSSFGGSGSSFGSSGSSFGGSSGFGPTSGTTPGAPGTATGTAGTTDPNSGGTSSTGLSGQSFGGAGIIGFEPASPQSSILIWKKKTHFNEWEFTYDPLSDMRTVSGNTGGIGQPASSSTTTPVGGSGSGGSGIGSGTTFGPTYTPTGPTTPTTPPQQ